MAWMGLISVAASLSASTSASASGLGVPGRQCSSVHWQPLLAMAQLVWAEGRVRIRSPPVVVGLIPSIEAPELSDFPEPMPETGHCER